MQGFSFVYKDAAVVFMVLFLQRRGWSEINKTEDLQLKSYETEE